MKIAATVWVVGIYFACCVSLIAQDVQSPLKEAKDAWQQGDLESTRFALQQAIQELDMAIGEEVLKLLPEKLGEMHFDLNDQHVRSANLGYAGLFVERTYNGNQEQSAKVQLIADSPLLAGVNALLALPAIGDPNRKRIRLGSYRGILQKQQKRNGEVSWDIQVPFGASLFSMNFQGISEESVILEMANTIPIESIAALLQ